MVIREDILHLFTTFFMRRETPGLETSHASASHPFTF